MAAHMVLFSEDLFAEALFPRLDRASKVALRRVCHAMRAQVDGSIVVVASPASGASAGELVSALVRWPRVKDLTLLGVRGGSPLLPLSTATLGGLERLTVREVGFLGTAHGEPVLRAPVPSPACRRLRRVCTHARRSLACSSGKHPCCPCLLTCAHVRLQAPRVEDEAVPTWRLSAFSSRMVATLQVLDVSFCIGLISIDAVRDCGRLRCLLMPLVSVSDLSPLVSCCQLEELWMADDVRVQSLAPLKACPRLRKLDLRDCHPVLAAQVHDLQVACTQLVDPSSVKVEGLVHELQPGIPPDMQAYAAERLAQSDAAQAAAAGAFPALVALLGPGTGSSPNVQDFAAIALQNLAASAEHDDAIAAAGAIPPLVLLLKSEYAQASAAYALQNLALKPENQSAIAAAGAIPMLVLLLEDSDDDDNRLEAVAGALCNLAHQHAQNAAAIVAAGALRHLAARRNRADLFGACLELHIFLKKYPY
jgi:hypothetical protein